LTASGRRWADWGLLLICNFIWGSQFVLVKVVQDQMGPLFATLLPMAMATVLLEFLTPRLRPGQLRRADVWGFFALGVLGQVFAQVFITWGVRLSLASNAALLSLALPVLTSLMAFLILREHMSRVRWISLALAILGSLVCSGIDWSGLGMGDRRYLWGNLMILLSVSGSAFYNVYSKRLLERYDPLQVLLYSYYAVLLVLAPLTYRMEPESFQAVPAYSWQVWGALAALAVLQYGLSMVLFLRVLTRLDATQAAVSNYLIPFFGLALAGVVLGEKVPLIAWIGGAVVLASTALVTVADSREARE
jgi:drug/metabolite transporter (DMT)-like permease